MVADEPPVALADESLLPLGLVPPQLATAAMSAADTSFFAAV